MVDSAALLQSPQAYCMAPWVNMTVQIGGATAPCCEIKGKFGDARKRSLADIWSGTEFQAFRARMLRDERTPRCWKCYEVEEAGGQSMRQDYNRNYAHKKALIEATPVLPQPVSPDIRFSNLCNFSCRMCWHSASSKWFAEARQLGWTDKTTALIKSFDSVEAGINSVAPLLDTVETIY